ncbi:MAG: MltA domain-containing protein [Alphaproteobacteria bacterium]|nr:MltA domain-containing protein [Alphaproteobacteria bacterium]
MPADSSRKTILRRIRASTASLALLALAACATEGPPGVATSTSARPPLPPIERTPDELDEILRAPSSPGATPVAVNPNVLPGWSSDRQGQVIPALLNSCGVLTFQRMIAIGVEATPDDWFDVCIAAAGVPPDDDQAARRFFEQWFTPVKVATENGDTGRFTGYYEAQLRGSWKKTARYDVPIYGYPGRPNGGRLPARAQIARGALGKHAKPLLWVDSAFDAYVLEVQGSGRVHMEDGKVVGIGYAGQNGHRFVDLTQVLQRRGALPDRSFAGLKRYLDRLPAARRQAVMNLNPSYVFFRIRDGKDPVGAQGVPLTAGRSLAVDPRHVPLGALIWLHVPRGSGGDDVRRLVVAQDTGGAISGPVRGDVFWGTGDAARGRALATNAPGQYYMLVPKTHTILTQLAK